MDPELVRYFDERFGRIDQRFDRVEQRLDSHDQRFDRIERRLDGHDRHFEAIARRFEAMEQRFESIDQHFEVIDQRFEPIDRRFESIDRQFAQVNQRIDDRFAEVKRHTGVLVEDLRKEVHLVAEGLMTHIEVRHGEDRNYFDRKFGDLSTLVHSSYDHLQQRVEHLERNQN